MGARFAETLREIDQSGDVGSVVKSSVIDLVFAPRLSDAVAVEVGGYYEVFLREHGIGAGEDSEYVVGFQIGSCECEIGAEGLREIEPRQGFITLGQIRKFAIRVAGEPEEQFGVRRVEAKRKSGGVAGRSLVKTHRHRILERPARRLEGVGIIDRDYAESIGGNRPRRVAVQDDEQLAARDDIRWRGRRACEEERRVDMSRHRLLHPNSEIVEPSQRRDGALMEQFRLRASGHETDFVQGYRLVIAVLTCWLQPRALELRHHISGGFDIALAACAAALQTIAGESDDV